MLLALAVAATALAAAPTAAAQDPVLPAVGSSQTCIGVSGGFLLEIHGFGFYFPPNTTGTATFTFANGDVVTVEATTDDTGHYRTRRFTLDLRDPELAALVGTIAYELASFGGVESTLTYSLVGCPTTPDGRVACLDGGFESYPELGFLNQGDCISWIATNRKNEPGQNVP